MDTIRDQVYDLLRDFERAVSRSVTAGINAASCQTRYDWDRAHKAEDELEAVRERVLARIVEIKG